MVQKPRGTEDLYGSKSATFFTLRMIIQNLMDLYNYSQIDTPIYESKELFNRGVGEQTDIVNKEMFEFADRKNRSMVLRPEGTAPTVRAIIEHKLYTLDNLPLKMFYWGPMFRYERPQSGRQRQFTQFGVEVFGASDVNIDAEIIILATNLLQNIGLTKYEVKINYLLDGNVKNKYVNDLQLKLDSFELCDDCKQRRMSNPLRVLDCKIDYKKFNDLPKMQSYLSNEQKKYYDRLIKILTKLDVKVVQDDLLVRGLDYYNGIVFEIVSTDEKMGAQSTLIGGGRYDHLVAKLGGPELPGVGFGMGVERILLALQSEKVELVNDKTLDVFFIALNEKARYFGNSIVLMLRASGLQCDMDYMSKSLKAQLKLAQKNNAKYAIFVGEQELKDNNVIIKNMQTNTEHKLDFDKIISFVKEGK